MQRVFEGKKAKNFKLSCLFGRLSDIFATPTSRGIPRPRKTFPPFSCWPKKCLRRIREIIYDRGNVYFVMDNISDRAFK